MVNREHAGALRAGADSHAEASQGSLRSANRELDLSTTGDQVGLIGRKFDHPAIVGGLRCGYTMPRLEDASRPERATPKGRGRISRPWRPCQPWVAQQACTCRPVSSVRATRIDQGVTPTPT